MVEVTNDDYKYCMLMPERIDSNNFMEGKAFGVGPDNDVTSTYDKIFAVNKESDVYQILSMCIYEVGPLERALMVRLEIRLRQDVAQVHVQGAGVHAPMLLQLRPMQPRQELLRLHQQPEGRLGHAGDEAGETLSGVSGPLMTWWPSAISPPRCCIFWCLRLIARPHAYIIMC